MSKKKSPLAEMLKKYKREKEIIKSESPKTEIKDFVEKQNINEAIEKCKYKIISTLQSKDDFYVMCTSLSGQIVCIEGDETYCINNPTNNIVIESSNGGGDSTWIESIKAKMDAEFYGCILISGGDISVLKRNDDGKINTLYYKSNLDEDYDEIPHIYPIIKLSDLEAKPYGVMEQISSNTEIIEEIQIGVRNDILDGLKESSSELLDSVNEVEEYIQNISKTLLNKNNDLNGYFEDNIEEYLNDEMDNDNKKLFQQLIFNLSVNFCEYNKITDVISSLRDIKDSIITCKQNINEKIIQIKSMNDMLKEKELFEIDEVEITL